MSDETRAPAVVTAFRILGYLAHGNSEAGVSEIARAIGVSKGTCFNVLGALLSQDAVQKDDRRALYRLGPKLVELGTATRRNYSARELLRQRLQPLVDDTNLTGLVGVPLAEDRGIVVLDRLLPRLSQHEPVIAAVGHVFPLTALAMGKVVLASLDDDDALAVAAQLGHDRERLPALRDQLAEIRRLGYAVSIGEYARHVNAVAAPLRGRHGEITAVLCLMGPAAHLIPDRVAAVAARLVAEAESIEHRTAGIAPLA